MKECAFCMEPAKMSGEHIHSDWMNEILPGQWKRIFNSSLGLHAEHDSPELNWKIKVVCERCNNGWMSQLEEKIAKPVLAPLIGGEVNIPIPQSSADSIAAFAFKTAIIIDLLRNGDGFEPFFSPRIRAAFKKTHAIPPNVNMWMCAYLSREQRADVFSGYYKGNMPLECPVELYVCTYSAGSFVFQVVSIKTIGHSPLSPRGDFDRASVPFWPYIRPKFVWPNRLGGLRNVEEFIQYHRRWETLRIAR
jgi:hypothetical protein